MKLTWYGHSCFLLETSNNTKILMDPFDSKIGYIPFKGSVDIVTISHDHFDHSNLTNLDCEPQIINSTNEYLIDSIKITGIPSFHDDQNGLKRGPNIIFLFEVDNLRLCHLGDLGHMLNDDYKDLLGNIDVLMIPVGDLYTIDGKTAYRICDLLSPKYIIPMHYKTPNLSFLLRGPEEFLIASKNVSKLPSNTLNTEELFVSTENTARVLLLSPPQI